MLPCEQVIMSPWQPARLQHTSLGGGPFPFPSSFVACAEGLEDRRLFKEGFV